MQPNLIMPDKINSLKDDKRYKKTLSAKYNWRISKGVISDPKFSVTTSMSYNGKFGVSIGVPIRIFMWMFKRYIIAKDVGAIRNEIIETVVNKNIGSDFDICALFTNDRRWISKDVEKIKLLLNICKAFISKADIEVIIFDNACIDSENQAEFIACLYEKLDLMFQRAICRIVRDEVFKSIDDYDKHLMRYGEIVMDQIKKSMRSGNLVDLNKKKKSDSEDK